MPDEYREFFVAAAGASGALIGLLFVAVSVFPERARRAATRVEYHTRASTALVVFTNALVLSLTALVPGVDLGWWTVVMGVIVFAFAAATGRLIITAALRRREHWSSLVLVGGLVLLSGTEFVTGIRLITDDTDLSAVHVLDYLVIVDVLVGIARAWQLVNMRDTGLLASLRVLTHGDDLVGEADDERDQPGQPPPSP
jgi:hypothetical protein